MKKLSLLLFFTALLGLVGCSAPKQETGAKFKVGLRTLAATGGTTLFPGGLVLYGVSGDRSFGRIMASDTADENVPNGVWDFYVLGWDGNGALDPMSGVVYCAYQKGVELLGEPVEINLQATNSNCADPAFGQTIDDGSGNKHFPKLRVQTCNNLDWLTDYQNTCDYDTNPATYKSNKGTALSYKVIARPFDRAGPNVRPIVGPELAFQCAKVATTMSGNLDVAAFLENADLNIPVMGAASQRPWSFTLRTYLGSDNCDDTLAHKDIFLPASAAQAQAKVFSDGGSFHYIFAKSTLDEVCASPFPNVSIGGAATVPFKGGMGTAGSPFVLCQGADLNKIANNYPTNSFILAKDVDMNPFTAATGSAQAPVCSFGGESFAPIGLDVDPTNCTYIGSSPFTGSFDGNNKFIKGMRVQKDDPAFPYMGFIPWLGANGKLLNTKFIRPEVMGEQSIGLVGMADAGSMIYNLEVLGGEFEANAGMIGAVVGQSGGSVEKVSAKAVRLRSRGGMYVGGIVGKGMGMMKSLSFEGDIEAQDDSNVDRVGGIAGSVESGATLEQASSRGRILSRAGNVGGIAGYNFGPIQYVYSNMLVHTEKNDNVNLGGLVGQTDGNLSFGYFAGQVSMPDIANCNTNCYIGDVYGFPAMGTRTKLFAHQNTGITSVADALIVDTDLADPSYMGLAAKLDIANHAGIWNMVAGRYPKLAFEQPSLCDEAYAQTSLSNQLASGRGSSTAPVAICTTNQFLDFLASNLAGKTYVIGEDLSVGMVSSSQMGVARGILNGAGKNLMNVALNLTASSDVGLFKEIAQGSVVKDLKLSGGIHQSSAGGSYTYGGLLAGVNNGVIEKVSVNGFATNPYVQNNFGLMVGKNGGKINKANVFGMMAGLSNMGGLAAENHGLITLSMADVKIEATSSNSQLFGGLVAQNKPGALIQQSEARSNIDSVGMGNYDTYGSLGLFAAVNEGTIINSLVDHGELRLKGGSAPSSAMDVGGFVGLNQGKVEKSLSLGRVVVTDNNHTSTFGGFIGSEYGSPTSNPGNFFFYNPVTYPFVLETDSVDFTTCSSGALSVNLMGGFLDGAYTTGDYMVFDHGKDSANIISPVSFTNSTTSGNFMVDACPLDDNLSGRLAIMRPGLAYSSFYNADYFSVLHDVQNFVAEGWSIGEFVGDGTGYNEQKLLDYHLALEQGLNPSLPVVWEFEPGEGAPRLLGIRN